MNPSNDRTQSETHPAFPSGEWEGFYTYSLGPDSEKHRMSFILNFDDGTISGGGSDDVGSFFWNGQYDVQKMTCVLVKSYLTHPVLYEGRVDENGIWGTWKIREHFTGGFHFWPKKNETEVAIEILVEEVNELLIERVIGGRMSYSHLL